MTIWLIILVIMVLPYLMFFTGRAIHRDTALDPRARSWLAAGVVLLAPVVIPGYWLSRIRRPH